MRRTMLWVESGVCGSVALLAFPSAMVSCSLNGQVLRRRECSECFGGLDDVTSALLIHAVLGAVLGMLLEVLVCNRWPWSMLVQL